MVLEGMLPYQLDGTAERSLNADGLRISLSLPMRRLAAAATDTAPD